MKRAPCLRCNSAQCSWDATVEAVIVSEVRHRVTIRTIDADGHSRNHHFPLDWRPNG